LLIYLKLNNGQSHRRNLPYSSTTSFFNEVLLLARTCHYEEVHTKQGTQLALQIFDQLLELSNFKKKENFFLLCTAYLYDIGVQTEGTKAHHKTALHITPSTPILQFDSKERLIARYHRKALPSNNHSHFAALDDQEKKMVALLAAILRVADGLDYCHENNIEWVKVSLHKHKIVFKCKSRRKNIDEELSSAARKSDLVKKIFSRKIVFIKDQKIPSPFCEKIISNF